MLDRLIRTLVLAYQTALHQITDDHNPKSFLKSALFLQPVTYNVEITSKTLRLCVLLLLSSYSFSCMTKETGPDIVMQKEIQIKAFYINLITR
jgi:hypothetical protein